MTTCPKFDEYVPLWLVFPGDRDLLHEMIAHKHGCEVCQENIHESEELIRKLDIEDEERKFMEWFEGEKL